MNEDTMPEGFPTFPLDWSTETTEITIPNSETKIFSTLDRKHGLLKNVAFVIHGLGEHSGRYRHFPHYLKESVDAVITFDLRGHGKSSGIRGHVPGFDTYADDAQNILEFWKTQLFADQNEKPSFHLIGHSMGGLIALRLLKKLGQGSLFKSATVSAPLIEPNVKVPVWKKAPAFALVRIAPTLTLPSGIDKKWISRDPKVIAAYDKDPLVHDKVSVMWFVDLQKILADTRQNLKDLHLPIQFIIPQDDHIVNGEVGLAYAESVAAPDKRICLYPEFYHEPFNELQKEGPFNDVNEWISRHN